MEVLGIDIGDHGLRGGIVDTAEGTILSDRISTPPLEETTPHKILARIHQVVNKEFRWKGPVGCAFPAPVNRGIVLSAKGIHESWVDANAEQLFSEITDNPVFVVNTTDATGLAEVYFGAGRRQEGLTLVLIAGKGVGSSLFMNGRMIPNTELGRMEIDGMTVEERASNQVRREGGISKESWASRLQPVLEHFEKVFHPDLFILGGQLGRRAKKVFPFIKITTTFKAAALLNDASIVGAAMTAARARQPEEER